MPQGSKSAGFSINELMLVALGYIPPLPDGTGEEPSLLRPGIDSSAAPASFYFDNIFGGHTSVKAAIEFLELYFLP
jgi:hypothetical protein